MAESGELIDDFVCFVSSNQNKISEADSILGNVLEINYVKIDVPEFQGQPDYIAISKCEAASQLVEGPVITEDSSLSFNALNGLPGPYIKWFYEKLGSDGLYKLLSGFEDKSASAICTLAFTDGPGKKVHLFHGETKGTIVPPKGEGGFGWDSCFLPEGKDQTYAELSFDEKNSISHRQKALMLMKEYLSRKCCKWVNIKSPTNKVNT